MVTPAGVVFGGALVAVGALMVRYPERLARFEERVDAIGSTRDRDGVDPAAWNVALTKAVGAAVAFVGAVVLLLGVVD